MAVIDNSARATKRWKLTIGEDEYQGHTSGIEVEPAIATWKGGDGNTITDDDGCQVRITMAQDSENATSLWRLFRDNAGTPATLVINPHHDGTFEESVDVQLVKPPLRMSRDGNIPEVQVTLDGVYTPPVEP